LVVKTGLTLQRFMINKSAQRTVSRLALSPPWSALILAIACLIALTWWWARGRVVPLPELPTAAAQQFPCVSYSPFRHPDLNPFNYLASVSPAQIEVDLKLLKSVTNCVRTYGLTQGLDSVPAVAKKLGMKVKLGIWLARDTQQNQAQLSKGLSLAQQYPDVIDLLIVGNEVLLRREMTPLQLRDILRSAKAQSPVPITYADVWEFWQRNASLAEQVDIVTVHILPYWEDQPVSVNKAAQHVREIGNTMQKYFKDKPIWIGETGWPAAGRQRDGAVAGKVEQAIFFRDLMLLAPTVGQSFNVIEAFDQPWKRSFEGAMGGYWGLFDVQGQPRVSLSGGAVEDSNWWRGFISAGLGGVLGVLLTSLVTRRYGYALLVGCFGGALLGAIGATQVLMSSLWDRSPFELAVSIGLSFVGASATVLSLVQLMINTGDQPTQMLSEKATHRLYRIADFARLAVLFCAASAALVLLLDSRYRPFPWWWFLAPTASWLALKVGTLNTVNLRVGQSQFLACALVIFSLGFMVQEGWHNAQAISYGFLMLSLAGVAMWSSSKWNNDEKHPTALAKI
jgi:exo-beta-1,3-glucanase (GH17 family)